MKARSRETRDALAERKWSEGRLSAWREILRTVAGELRLSDDKGDLDMAKALAAVEHLAAARAALCSVCEDFGDNDWSNDLHLADVIDKHLARHLHAEREEEAPMSEDDDNGYDSGPDIAAQAQLDDARARAEKAEARVAELETQNEELRGRLTNATDALRERIEPVDEKLARARMLLRRAFDAPDIITMLAYVERVDAIIGGRRMDSPTPESIDVDGLIDAKGVQMIGRATRQADGTWQCLANVGGALCRVEFSISISVAGR